jgi:hypothetical protein
MIPPRLWTYATDAALRRALRAQTENIDGRDDLSAASTHQKRGPHPCGWTTGGSAFRTHEALLESCGVLPRNLPFEGIETEESGRMKRIETVKRILTYVRPTRAAFAASCASALL